MTYACNVRETRGIRGTVMARMMVGEIFRALSQESFWAGCSVKMRLLASRYYAGVDSLNDLRACAQRRPVMTSRYTGEDFTLPPQLTTEEVATIIRLR